MSKPDFGFAFAPNRALDLSAPPTPEAQQLFVDEPSLKACMACGQCAAVCTAGVFTRLAFYRLVLQVYAGELEAAGCKAGQCMLCGKCQMTCPRGVNIRNAMLLMAALAPQNT